jgi:hypothetical protein
MRLSVCLRGSCTSTGAWACKQADHAAASRLLTCMEHHMRLSASSAAELVHAGHACLRKEAYPKVLMGWARTILLLHVEGIDINASLSPCVPARLLASRVCVSTASWWPYLLHNTGRPCKLTRLRYFQMLRQSASRGAVPVLQVGSRGGRVCCIEQIDLVRCRMSLNRRPLQRRPERGDSSAFQGFASHARQMPYAL